MPDTNVQITISAKDAASASFRAAAEGAKSFGTSLTGITGGPLKGTESAIKGIGTVVSGLATPFKAAGSAAQGFGTSLSSGVSKGVSSATSSLKGLGGQLDGLFSKLKGPGLAGILTATFGGSLAAAVGGSISQLQQLSGATAKLQRETGLTAEGASALLAVFQRFGIDSDGASKSLGLFAKQLAGSELSAEELAGGAGKAKDRLKEMGVAVLDANGAVRPMNDVLLDVADRFKSLPDGAEKTALAMQLFGKSGKDMLPILNQGKAGILALEETAKKLGLTLSQDNVDAVKKYGVAQKDMSQALSGLRLQLGVAFLPLLTVFATHTAELAKTVIPIFSNAIKVLGGIISTYVVPIFKVWFDMLKMVWGSIIGPLVDSFKKAAGGAKGLGDATSPLQKVFTMVKDAIVTFGLAFTGKWQDSSKIEGIHRIIGLLGIAFAHVRDAVITFVQAITGQWTDSTKIEGIHRVIGNIGLVIRNDVIPAIQQFVGWITNIAAAFQSGGFSGGMQKLLGDVGSFAKTLGAKLLEWGKAFVEWIAPFIPPMLLKLGELYIRFYQWIGEQIPPLLVKLGEWGKQFIEWIAPYIPPMLQKLGELMVRVNTWILQQIPPLLKQLGEWGKQFLEWIAPQIPPMLAKLAELMGRLLLWIAEQIPPLTLKLLELGKQFVEWVLPQIPPMLGKLAELSLSLMGWIASQIPVIVAKMLEWTGAFLSWIGDTLLHLPGEIIKLDTAILTWIADMIPKITVKIGEWSGAFLGWVGEQLLKLPGEVLKLDQAIIKWIGDMIPKITAAVGGWVAPFLAPFKEIGSAIGGFFDSLGQAVNWVGSHLGLSDPIIGGKAPAIRVNTSGGIGGAPASGGVGIGGVPPMGAGFVPSNDPLIRLMQKHDGWPLDEHGKPVMGLGGFPNIGNALGGLKNLAGDAWSGVSDAVGKGAGGLLDLAMHAVGLSGLSLPGPFAKMGTSLFGKMTGVAKDSISDLIDQVKKNLGSSDVVQAALSFLSSDGATWNNWCEKFVGDVADRVHAGRPRMATAQIHANSIHLNPGIGPPGSVQYWNFDPAGHVDINGPTPGWGISTGAWGIKAVPQEIFGPSAGWAPINMAGGGVISEHVAGIGMASGRRYNFGEGGSAEAVIPLNRIGRGGGGDTYITVEAHGPLLAPNNLIDVIHTGLLRKQSRNGSLGLK